MPLPVTRDVGTVIRALKEHHPGMPQKQKVAIALSQARKAGASIPRKRGNRTLRRFKHA